MEREAIQPNVILLYRNGRLLLVMRGLVPRIYPLRRRDGVWALRRVGPRNECAGDEKSGRRKK